MSRLESDLRQLDRTRRTQGDTAASPIPAAHQRSRLVGYTNAGKSTLLNRLCGADVLVEDRLFSTLDPRTRQLDLPGGETVLLTDTVGFLSLQTAPTRSSRPSAPRSRWSATPT